MRDSGEFEVMPKKEALLLGRELVKLERNLGGIATWTSDPTRCSCSTPRRSTSPSPRRTSSASRSSPSSTPTATPTSIDYVIPGNDDAIRAGNLMARIVADAVEEGRYIAQPPFARRGRRTLAPRTRHEWLPSRPRPAGQALAEAKEREARRRRSALRRPHRCAARRPAGRGCGRAGGARPRVQPKLRPSRCPGRDAPRSEPTRPRRGRRRRRRSGDGETTERGVTRCPISRPRTSRRSGSRPAQG